MPTASGSEWKLRLRAAGLVRRRRPAPPPAHAPTTPVGRDGEERAADYLSARGVRVLARNVRTSGGEIDLVGEAPGLLLFVEVKRRRSAARGTAAEAVTPWKRRRIVRAARAYLAEYPSARRRRVRFDVVAIEDEPDTITWIEGAFDAE